MTYVLKFQSGEMVGNTYISGTSQNHQTEICADDDLAAIKLAAEKRQSLIDVNQGSTKVGYFELVKQLATNDELKNALKESV